MDLKERIDRINAARKEHGLSIQQLADMCQISASTISRTLSGKTEPTEYTLQSIENALGITDKPVGEPIPEIAQMDPIVARYINMQEVRILRLRAHYNMLLAEKNRWIRMLFLLSLILVTFICAILILDVIHPDIGWIRQQLGLGSDWVKNMLSALQNICLNLI